jgi:hypothetical protein
VVGEVLGAVIRVVDGLSGRLSDNVVRLSGRVDGVVGKLNQVVRFSPDNLGVNERGMCHGLKASVGLSSCRGNALVIGSSDGQGT